MMIRHALLGAQGGCGRQAECRCRRSGSPSISSWREGGDGLRDQSRRSQGRHVRLGGAGGRPRGSRRRTREVRFSDLRGSSCSQGHAFFSSFFSYHTCGKIKKSKSYQSHLTDTPHTPINRTQKTSYIYARRIHRRLARSAEQIVLPCPTLSSSLS